jgi:hypothetical protein
MSVSSKFFFPRLKTLNFSRNKTCRVGIYTMCANGLAISNSKKEMSSIIPETVETVCMLFWMEKLISLLM